MHTEFLLDTELWSFDRNAGRAIKAMLRPNGKRRQLTELHLQWDDGQPVEWPVLLTAVDMKNLINLLQDGLRAQGCDAVE